MDLQSLEEGKRIQSKISEYQRVFEYFDKTHEDAHKIRLSEYFEKAQMIPCKDQMARVAIIAIMESCELCIQQLTEKFDKL